MFTQSWGNRKLEIWSYNRGLKKHVNYEISIFLSPFYVLWKVYPFSIFCYLKKAFFHHIMFRDKLSFTISSSWNAFHFTILFSLKSLYYFQYFLLLEWKDFPFTTLYSVKSLSFHYFTFLKSHTYIILCSVKSLFLSLFHVSWKAYPLFISYETNPFSFWCYAKSPAFTIWYSMKILSLYWMFSKKPILSQSYVPWKSILPIWMLHHLLFFIYSLSFSNFMFRSVKSLFCPNFMFREKPILSQKQRPFFHHSAHTFEGFYGGGGRGGWKTCKTPQFLKAERKR